MTRENNCIEINDIQLSENNTELFAYFITNILENERVVIGKFLYQDEDIVELFNKTGFYIDKIQYEMKRELH